MSSPFSIILKTGKQNDWYASGRVRNKFSRPASYDDHPFYSPAHKFGWLNKIKPFVFIYFAFYYYYCYYKNTCTNPRWTSIYAHIFRVYPTLYTRHVHSIHSIKFENNIRTTGKNDEMHVFFLYIYKFET